MRNKLRQWMYGRYGYDNYSRCLLVLYVIIWIIELIVSRFSSVLYTILQTIDLILFIYILYRTFSKNIYKRQQENFAYQRLTYRIRQTMNRYKHMWQYRKTHKYFKCPYCHQYLRVPKGKGKITINCPHCHKQFDRKS